MIDTDPKKNRMQLESLRRFSVGGMRLGFKSVFILSGMLLIVAAPILYFMDPGDSAVTMNLGGFSHTSS